MWIKKIVSVLNNSAVMASRDDGEVMVLVGKGIGFSRRPGQNIDPETADTVFSRESGTGDEMKKLLEHIPADCFDACAVIFRYLNRKLKTKLSERIYLTLADHISSALERSAQQIQLLFAMLAETRVLYPKEYQCAQWAVEYLNATFDVELPEEECGFLVLHIVNAQDPEKQDFAVRTILRLTREMSLAVQNYLGDDFDYEGMNWTRFLVHMKFLATRLIRKVQLEPNPHTSLSFSSSLLEKTDSVVKRMQNIVRDGYDTELNELETAYIRIHLGRLMGVA